MTKTAVQESQEVASVYSLSSAPALAPSLDDHSPEMVQVLTAFTTSLELPEELPMTEGYNLVLVDSAPAPLATTPPPSQAPISYGLCQITGNTASICYDSIVALMRSLLQSSLFFFDNATAQNNAANESAYRSYQQNKCSANKQYQAGKYQAGVSFATASCTAAGAMMPYTNSARLGTDKMGPASQRMAQAEAEGSALQQNQGALHNVNATHPVDPTTGQSQYAVTGGGTTSPSPHDERFVRGNKYGDACRSDLQRTGKLSDQRITDYRGLKNTGLTDDQIRAQETKTAFESMNRDEREMADMNLTRGIHDANARINTQQGIMTMQTTWWNTIGNSMGSLFSGIFTIEQKRYEKDATILQGVTKLWDSSSSQTNSLAQQWSSAAVDAAKESREMLNTIQATVRASALN